MLDIEGRSVLSLVLERCLAIPGVDVVVCATIDDATCDPIAAEASRCGAEIFRGSEKDVLDRYWRAARATGAETVLRVTSDCPLIDPTVCDDVLALLSKEGADFATNNMPKSWPHGLDCEAFTFEWLDRAAQEAIRPSEREHVTPFMRHHPEVRKVNLPCPAGDLSDNRWTLDTDADMAFMRAIFPLLADPPVGWRWQNAFAAVSGAPEIAQLNAGADAQDGYRRSMKEDEAAGFEPR
jgi:spore coat polysaccharide biosynthesis protein SpsF (cytidylyltransferase family)